MAIQVLLLKKSFFKIVWIATGLTAFAMTTRYTVIASLEEAWQSSI